MAALLLVALGILASSKAAAQTVIDVVRGNGAVPEAMTVYDGRLFFGFDDGLHGKELWAYEAATGTARLVVDACPGRCSADFWELVHYDEKLYFTARRRASGASDLWYYDAATDEARPAHEFGDPAEGVSPFSFAVYQGRLFFEADGRTDEDEWYTIHWLWAYDARTGRAEPIGTPESWRPGFRPRDLTVLDDRLYFSSETRVGNGLFAYDGVLDRIISPLDESADDVRHPRGFTVHGGRLFFSGEVRDHGYELVTFDPATGQLDIAAETWPGSWGGSPYALSSHGATLYFSAKDREHGHELWAYSSSTGRATLVADMCPGACSSSPSGLVAYDGQLFFTADDGRYGISLDAYNRAGRSLFRYHTGQEQPLRVDGVPPVSSEIVLYEDMLFFGAADVEQGHELWAYDGATDESHRVADLSDEEAGSLPRPEAVSSGTLYFNVAHPVYGPGVWAYDDEGGPRRVVAGAPSYGWSTDGYAGIRANDDRAFFSAFDEAHGAELWYSDDGRTAHLAADICEGPCSSDPEPLLLHEGDLYLSAYSEAHGHELWRYATASGTPTLASDVAPGPASSSPDEPVAVGGRLVFVASDSTHGRELWIYDPARGTSQLAADIAPGPESSHLRRLTPLGSRVYLCAWDTSGSNVGWYYEMAGSAVSSRRSSSIERVEHVSTGSSFCRSPFVTAYDGRLFFRAFDDVHGEELWSYDPARRRSQVVSDIVPGPEGSYPVSGTVFDDRLFFTSSQRDDATGLYTPLWYYDRTTDTVRVASDVLVDIPGMIANLYAAGNRLYFEGPHPTYGRELWYVTSYDVRKEDGSQPPRILGNAPNPFGERTQIHYVLFERAHVRIDVYDILGRHVSTLVDDEQDEGMRQVTLRAASLAAGVYLCRIKIGGHVTTHTVVLAQ